MAFGQRESNGVYVFWQMKNHTLAVSFLILWVPESNMNGEL
jgi:hypothetical protein